MSEIIETTVPGSTANTRDCGMRTRRWTADGSMRHMYVRRVVSHPLGVLHGSAVHLYPTQSTWGRARREASSQLGIARCASPRRSTGGLSAPLGRGGDREAPLAQRDSWPLPSPSDSGRRLAPFKLFDSKSDRATSRALQLIEARGRLRGPSGSEGRLAAS